MEEKDRRRMPSGQGLKLLSMEKTRDSRYLKNYTLTYENLAGREKQYEIVSRHELSGPEDLGRRSSGVSIVAYSEDMEKMLLLREFRMGVNAYVINNAAGMRRPEESIEECIRRELYEETGLSVKKILHILPPAYAAVALTDSSTNTAFVVAEGEISYHTSENEDICARFYTKEEVKELLRTEMFSARTQIAAYLFCSM